jgi:RimJ/RimL family protein N-acetyltransferase
MFGPRIDGGSGTELRPPTKEDYTLFATWQLEPGTTRFWGPRFSTQTPTEQEERMKKDGESQTAILWSIAYQGETVGFTGVFGIDWISRDGETGIFIGRSDLYGRGIASEAVRLRMAFIWKELGLRRTHNWIALPNRGSWRANQKSGYAQIGTYPHSWYRSGEWVDEWLGEAFAHTFPADKLPSAWDRERASEE